MAAISYKGCRVKLQISRISYARVLSFIEIGKLRPICKQPKMATKGHFIVFDFRKVEVSGQIVLNIKANRDVMEDK